MDPSRVPHLVAPPAPDAPLHDDPDFVRAADWLARRPAEPRAIVLGAPFAGGSISRARCDLAPAAIRRALGRFSVWSSDRGVSIEALPVLDVGDVEGEADVEKTQRRITETVAAIVEEADVPVVLVGGDNSVTVGGARGAGADGLITLDAHHDCRDYARGPTNGSPVRQLVDDGIGAVAQLGVHGFSNSEANARWALEHKVHSVTAARVRRDGVARTVDAALRLMGGARRVWADVDLDVLDRAFAPGAPGAMPGGLAPTDLEEAAYLLGRDRRVVGLDIVEVDPAADVGEATVRAAAAVLLSFLAGVAAR